VLLIAPAAEVPPIAILPLPAKGDQKSFAAVLLPLWLAPWITRLQPVVRRSVTAVAWIYGLCSLAMILVTIMVLDLSLSAWYFLPVSEIRGVHFGPSL
jgi:hypothetical protein